MLAETLESGSSLNGSSWLMSATYFPSGFVEWFFDQLVSIRAEGRIVTITWLLLADALPCTWSELLVLWGTAMQSKTLASFRVQDVHFSPNTQIFLSAGKTPRKLVKRVNAITFTAGGFSARGEDIFEDWRPRSLPTFTEPLRLIFDAPQVYSLDVLKVAQVLSHHWKGEAPTVCSGSYGDTAAAKRKSCHILFSIDTRCRPNMRCSTTLEQLWMPMVSTTCS